MRGDFNHLRCFDFHCLGPPHGDLCSWGGTCVCIRGLGFCLRVQGPGLWASVGRAEGLRVGQARVPCLWVPESPAPPLYSATSPPKGSPSALSLPLPPRHRQSSAPFPAAGIFQDPPCVISFSRFSGWIQFLCVIILSSFNHVSLRPQGL